MMNIGEIENGKPPILIVDNGKGKYTIKKWSPAQEKFIDFE